MTAPVDHRAFATSGDPFVVTATLWRGAMLDRFSRMEKSALDCLVVLRDCGLALSTDAFHEGAKARLRALISAIEDDRFGGMRKPTLRYLARLSDQNDMRSSIAHGTMRQEGGALVIEWMRCRGSDRIEHSTRTIDLHQMLKELTDLDALQRNVSSQLGQIRRIARQGCAA